MKTSFHYPDIHSSAAAVLSCCSASQLLSSAFNYSSSSFLPRDTPARLAASLSSTMPKLYTAIQSALITAIAHPQFNAALPPLSDDTWTRLLQPSIRACEENERLEFLGDALMYATIGRQLYSQIPDGTPHLYTVRRCTFSV